MSLGDTIATFLNSWDGHTSYEAMDMKRVTDVIKASPTYDINKEYNILSDQKLWVDQLIGVFYEELLDRIMTNGTFVISTSWPPPDIPYVYIRLGLDEYYMIDDTDGVIISSSNEHNTIILTNDSFDEHTSKRLMRLLLNHNLMSTIQVFNDHVKIISIRNADDLIERIVIDSSEPNGEIMDVHVNKSEVGDFLIYRLMLDELTKKTFGLIDV